MFNHRTDVRQKSSKVTSPEQAGKFNLFPALFIAGTYHRNVYFNIQNIRPRNGEGVRSVFSSSTFNRNRKNSVDF
jgi:hypothetical protein